MKNIYNTKYGTMRVKAKIKFHRKEDYLMSSGKIITMEMILKQLPNVNKKEFPEDYQFRWAAFSRENPKEIIRFDNHDHKEPHWHDGDYQEFFSWVSLDEAYQSFYKKVINKFGKFEKLLVTHFNYRYEEK